MSFFFFLRWRCLFFSFFFLLYWKIVKRASSAPEDLCDATCQKGHLIAGVNWWQPLGSSPDSGRALACCSADWPRNSRGKPTGTIFFFLFLFLVHLMVLQWRLLTEKVAQPSLAFVNEARLLQKKSFAKYSSLNSLSCVSVYQPLAYEDEARKPSCLNSSVEMLFYWCKASSCSSISGLRKQYFPWEITIFIRIKLNKLSPTVSVSTCDIHNPQQPRKRW